LAYIWEHQIGKGIGDGFGKCEMEKPKGGRGKGSTYPVLHRKKGLGGGVKDLEERANWRGIHSAQPSIERGILGQ